jgi:hypothetical protein
MPKVHANLADKAMHPHSHVFPNQTLALSLALSFFVSPDLGPFSWCTYS